MVQQRCGPPYKRGSGIVCGCNTGCCPPPICNKVKAMWTFFSSSLCNQLTLFETDVRCEDGIIKIYRRYITITLTDWTPHDPTQ